MADKTNDDPYHKEKVCNFCNSSNPLNANFCRACGEKFIVIEKSSSKNDILCIKCSSNNPEGSKYCKYCGTSLEEAIDEAQLNKCLFGLNKKQKEAVVSREKRVLVLAGAGSGKTKTIIQRILYLISQGANAENILAITFTRNAANEMKDRLIEALDTTGEYKQETSNKRLSYFKKENMRREYMNKVPLVKDITIKTFHGLCYSILKHHGGNEYDNRFKILEDKNYKDSVNSDNMQNMNVNEAIRHSMVKLSEDTNYLIKLKTYVFLNYVKEPKNKKEIKYPKTGDKYYTTLDGRYKVRSKSERYIADWLFTHNINYIYEDLVVIDGVPFRPDFHIIDAGIHLEHISRLSYPTDKKEERMKKANMPYLKIYEETTEDIQNFYRELQEIVLPKLNKDISPTKYINFDSEFIYYQRELGRFIDDVNSAINMMKTEDIGIKEVYERGIGSPHERIRDFYKLFKPIYEEYHSLCINKSYLDFNDLLLKTLSLLNKDPSIKKHYQDRFRHVLVDEFQDVNSLQVKLIKELLSEDSFLMCVGDDWQSIYGWRGSEVAYIVDFEKYFENPKIIKYDLNYRSQNTIVTASNEVIKNNKHKVDKEIKSFTNKGKKIYLYMATKEEEDGSDKVYELIKTFGGKGYTKEDILILYRKHGMYDKYKEKLKDIEIPFSHKTIHSAKGLEAKAVILIGMTGGNYGFPSLWDEDSIFEIIKKTNHELKMEEERRLFYVAITRAKEELFIISEIGNESSFVTEIPGEFIDRKNFLILDIKDNSEVYCLECGRKLEDDFKYCPQCGKKLDAKIDN